MIMCGHQVVVPPTIAAEQSRLTGRLGEGVVLRCHAHGSPAPTIHWYKSVGSLAGEVRQIPFTHLLDITHYDMGIKADTSRMLYLFPTIKIPLNLDIKAPNLHKTAYFSF